jgi:hypothetical protein
MAEKRLSVAWLDLLKEKKKKKKADTNLLGLML